MLPYGLGGFGRVRPPEGCCITLYLVTGARLLWPQGLDFFGGAPLKADEVLRAAQWEADNEEDSVVVLADVWLDKPETLDRLRTVFAGATL